MERLFGNRFLDPSDEGERMRRAEKQLCKLSVLHFIKYWCWLWNPQRPDGDQDLPYLPYDFQEELILYLRDAIIRCNSPKTFERENLIIEKCREMAGSWTVYAVILHDFLFWNGSYLILSWKLDEVDQLGNMDTPFQKMRYMLNKLPQWILPAGWNWREHSGVGILRNPAGASIDAESVTKSAGAGGRKRAIIWDEMGKIHDGTDFPSWRSMSGTARLRIGISTPEGAANQFGQLGTGEGTEKRTIISLNWWKDPIKTQNAEFVPKDKQHPDCITSPWYEEQVANFDAQTLASQVNINYKDSITGGIFSEQYSVWHQARALKPVPGKNIIVCIDPGVHMFASFTQFDHYDRYLILDEVYDPNAHIDFFMDKVLQIQADRFRGFKFDYIGDPAGGTVNSAMHKLKSEYMYLLEKYGICVEYNFQSPNTSEWVENRVRAMRAYLTKACPQLTLQSGAPSPMVLVDLDKCQLVHKALAGGYRFDVGIDNKVTTRVKRSHPDEDAADCVTYPLIWRGVYKYRETKPTTEKRSNRRVPEWKSPAEHRR